MTVRIRHAVLLILLAALSGCSLPLAAGIHQPGQVPAGQGGPGEIHVLPPGPRPGADQDGIIAGFLDAQSDPDHRHDIARSFLAPSVRAAWDDSAGAAVYDPFTRQIALDDRDPTRVVLTAALLGQVDRGGSYLPLNPAAATLQATFRLARVAGEWRITAVPPGLELSPADRERSFTQRDVYFLAHSYGQTSDTPHLVPDPVFLPVTDDPAGALVQRLLAGWSEQLGGGAVETAVPAGTRLLAPVSTAAGTVTVDLSAAVCRISEPQRERLSAQLVWTLRGLGAGFARLDLRCAGSPVRLAGQAEPQDRAAWPDYDPDGLGPSAPAYAIDRHAIHNLDGAPVPGPAGDGTQPVDVAALSPGSSLALLARSAGSEVLRIGPLRGPSYPVRLTGAGLGSPSWGSGEQGLWLLKGSSILLVPNRQDLPVAQVPLADGPLPGLRVLRISRDGARVALIAGAAGDGRVYVGRVEPAGSGVQVGGLRPVAFALHNVRDVAWETGTSLVALGRLGLVGPPLPVRVAIDGSSVVRLPSQGLGLAVSVTAAPNRPLVVGGLEGGEPRVFRAAGAVFLDDGPGSQPFYAG